MVSVVSVIISGSQGGWSGKVALRSSQGLSQVPESVVAGVTNLRKVEEKVSVWVNPAILWACQVDRLPASQSVKPAQAKGMYFQVGVSGRLWSVIQSVV